VFSTADAADGQPVVIVTQSLASAYWPHTSPLGHRLRVFAADQTASPWMTVVGVVGDVIDDWYDRRNTPTLFVPEVQRPAWSVTLLARTAGDPNPLGPALRRALHAVDRDQSERLVISLDQSLADRTSGLRVIGTIMAGIGAVALLLAAVGIYSLMAYYVSQRRAEIGIRMALGATQAAVVRLTLGHTARLSVIGLGIGSVLAVLAGIGTRSALFGIIPLSPYLIVGLTLALALIAFASTLPPLRQALRVAPSAALRTE
jgi:putative ABC transport system permease protein